MVFAIWGFSVLQTRWPSTSCWSWSAILPRLLLSQRNKKNRDVKCAPFPELLASQYRRGIMFVSGRAGGVVYAVIEPRGNVSWHRAGFEQNDTTQTPKDASYFLSLLCLILSTPWIVPSKLKFTAYISSFGIFRTCFYNNGWKNITNSSDDNFNGGCVALVVFQSCLTNIWARNGLFKLTEWPRRAPTCLIHTLALIIITIMFSSVCKCKCKVIIRSFMSQVIKKSKFFRSLQLAFV